MRPVCLLIIANSIVLAGGSAAMAQAWDGLTLYNPINGSSSNRTTLINNSGQVIHQWVGASAIASTPYLLQGGDLMRPCQANGPMNCAAKGGRVQKIAMDGTILWDFTLSDSNNQPHHDITLMPNGNVLLLAYERKTQSQGQAAGRPSLNSEIWPEQLLEVKPTGPLSGEIVWEWHLWDHMIQDVSSGYPNYGVVSEHPEKFDINNGQVGGGPSPGDWLHCNAIDYNPILDQIVMSSNSWDEIFVIDHGISTEEAAGPAGDILYRWGNPSNYDRSGTHVLWNVHGVNWIDEGLPGAGNLLLFNNGNDDGTSDLIEFIPPLQADGTYEISETAPFEPVPGDYVFFYEQNGFHGDHLCGVYRLPNGNTIATDGPGREIREVNAAGQIVWQHTTSSPLMRAVKYPMDILDPPAPCEGDVTGDDQVGVDDLLLIVANFGQATPDGDANGDGVVDTTDILLALAQWGPCQ